ncbi:MAG: tetratricopeptide repeat protein [Phycisphaeraceae bacterium]|nr:tetratricopeptide repeat protein [Phycisphaeraceae bacterium]
MNADQSTSRSDPDATIKGSGREASGEQIGRYKLLEKLGEGGFGSVWAAEQREPVKRRVALKIIKLGMDTREVIARFEAERQALATMDHPNIAKVLDAGSTETGRPYFVMELVKGVPITDYCDTEKVDTAGRLNLFMTVCHAIQHAHQKGIIHRDIKPSNVIVTVRDGLPIPKVIDFGIAKATNQELTDKTLYTQHGQMIGTPAYMSPEQAEMSGLDIDTRSDIYSLGVLLYELLTGTTPFDGESLLGAGLAEMMRIIREETPHKPSTRLSDLGDTAARTAVQRSVVDPTRLVMILRGDLDWIAMKCLEKDRTRRYETADGLAADIKRHLEDEPVTAGPPSARYRMHKFVKRNRGQVIAAGVITAILILGVVGTSAGMVWALREKNRADAEATRASKSAEAEARARLTSEANEQTAIANEQRAAAEAQRAERELARATEIKRLVSDMLTGLDPAKAQRADTTLLKGILDDASARIGSGEITDELIAAELHYIVGNVYRMLGLFPQAEQHLPVVVEIRTRLLSEEHRETLASMLNLARLYWNQGRFSEAEPLYLRTLAVSRRVLGEEHPGTLDSMCSLALLYRDQGRDAEAEQALLKTLELQQRVLGEEHPGTLQSMHSLGLVYVDQGRYAEAEPLLLKTLELQKRVLGQEHPNTLRDMANLALLYAKQGRYDEAERLHLETLEILKGVLGEEHPTTLGQMSSLAELYINRGRYVEAEQLILRTLEIQRRVLGDEHQETLVSMLHLAKLYQMQGRLVEAESWFVDGSEILTRVLGEEHPTTLQSIVSLAIVYRDQRRYAEAEPLFLRTLAVCKRVLGDEHRTTMSSISGLAMMYSAQGRYAEAEPLCLHALEVQRRVLGEGHPETLGWMNNLAILFWRQGRYAEAEPLYLDTIAIERRVLGEEHPSTLGSITNLGLLYDTMGRYADSAAMFEKSLPIKRRVLGEQHPWTRSAMKGLANAYMHLDRRDEALPLYRELLGLQAAAADKPDANADALNAAAWTLLTFEIEEVRDAAKALGYATRACALTEAEGGDDLWMYLDTLALAQHMSGDNASAVETQKRAISLMPAEADPNMADRLAEYQAALDAGG